LFSIKVTQKVSVSEGSESEEFWNSVNGKGDYNLFKDQMIGNGNFEAMLFEISN